MLTLSALCRRCPVLSVVVLLIGLAVMSGVAPAAAASLTVYSAGPNRLISDLAADFQASSGIRVQVFQGTTGQVMARLEAERSNPVADVVISASWESAAALKVAGDLLPHTPPGADQVPDFLRDSHFIAQGAAALALVWNTRGRAPRPSDWGDLTDPDYRRQVLMPDPAQSGAAFEWLIGLLTLMDEESAWALIAQLRGNGMVVSGPNARALNPVLQGARSVVVAAVDYIAYGQQAAGEFIEVIFPPSGTVLAPRPIMILKSSRHPEIARAFVDHVLSPEGQARVAESFLIPARTDVPARRPGLDELTVIPVDRETMSARREELLLRFRQETR